MKKNTRCLFTYQELQKKEKLYSEAGLKKLHLKLKQLKVFPYSTSELILEAQKLAAKISIQGVQPKLSAVLNLQEQQFCIVEKGGTFIIKPQVSHYPQLPENEDLTMHLAQIAGLQVPWHGLILCQDGSLSYVVRRFDRQGRSNKLSQEDFAQLIGASRSTKYLATMERVAGVIDEFCSFPSLEYIKLFQRTIFSFLIGNEDMHLKNFSLITDKSGKILQTPVYDMLNSSIALSNPTEELALELNGKKSKFTKKDFIDGYAVPELFISKTKAEKEIQRLLNFLPAWNQMIDHSFLSKDMQKKYKAVLAERSKRLS